MRVRAFPLASGSRSVRSRPSTGCARAAGRSARTRDSGGGASRRTRGGNRDRPAGAVQIALERRYDRSGDPRRLRAALRAGATVYLPQVHQVLPRVMRLMVALRAGLLGPFREEASFLFLVDGQGRAGLGLHHDGDVDAFWLQLEGRRRVTLGPPVLPGARQEMTAAPRRGAGWRTLELRPGSLLHLPPRTPHEVICHGAPGAVADLARLRRSAAGGHDVKPWRWQRGCRLRPGLPPPSRPSAVWTQCR